MIRSSSSSLNFMNPTMVFFTSLEACTSLPITSLRLLIWVSSSAKKARPMISQNMQRTVSFCVDG